MKTRIILLQAFVLAAVSCSDKLTNQSPWDNGVMASIPGYEDAHATRVRFTNGLDVFYWTNGDCIGVCRNAGSANGTAAFTLLKGGETIGNFINDAFSLLPNSEYYAFYPFVAGTTANVFPINLANQTQTSNNDVSHIGAFNYMATSFTTDDNGKASFTFSNIGAVIQLHFTADNEETYQSLSITSSGTPFTIRANYNLTNGTYTSDGSYDTFRVLFGEDGMHVYNGENVVITAVVLPDDLSQSTLTFSIKNKAGAVVKEMDLAGYAFASGKLYHFYEDNSKGNPPHGGCPDGNHPHAIDFGLPSGTLWSCMDVGAIDPLTGGIGFAWGETYPVEKNTSDWANYKFMTDSYSDQWGISKYQIADGQTDGVWYNDAGVFIGDNKTTLDLADDAARQNWGAPWRMPTREEYEELVNYTVRSSFFTDYNGTGKSGWVYYKKKNHGDYTLWDPHIFLRGGYNYPYYASYQWIDPLWTSSLTGKTHEAYAIRIYSGPDSSWENYGNPSVSRISKLRIRPVQSKNSQ
jgi:hypothetical protein